MTTPIHILMSGALLAGPLAGFMQCDSVEADGEPEVSEKQGCNHVAKAPYSLLYKLAWGEKIDCSNAGFMLSFKRIAVALAAWQSSSEVNSFSSKRDIALAAEIK